MAHMKNRQNRETERIVVAKQNKGGLREQRKQRMDKLRRERRRTNCYLWKKLNSQKSCASAQVSPPSGSKEDSEMVRPNLFPRLLVLFFSSPVRTSVYE